MRIELKESHLELLRLKGVAIQATQNDFNAYLNKIAEEFGITGEDAKNWKFDGKGFEKPDETPKVVEPELK